jgi:beta-glucanase (GH16 family)
MRPPLYARVLVLLAALLGCGCASSNDWRLTWSDEFDGDAGQPPDPSKWNFEVSGAGFGNGQLEYDTSRPVNASLDGQGNLAITAREEAFGGNKYTSARINTRGLFEQTYGRFEARIKLPLGRGLWPAFWMLGADVDQDPWPACGEVDVMEYRGQEPFTVHGSVHGPGYSGGSAKTATFTIPGAAGFDAEFHVFAVEWDPGQLKFFVDGGVYEIVTAEQLPAGALWVLDHPVFVLLNLAVGGGYVGAPDSTTVFPQTMLVDYVRVYERAP